MSYPYLINTKENRVKIAQLLRDLAFSIEEEDVDIVHHLSSAEYVAEISRLRGSVHLTIEARSDEVEFGKNIRDFSISAHSSPVFGSQ